MKIPKRLGSNRIVDCVVELRFDSPISVPILYTTILKVFPGKVIDLPIMQLPPAIRDSDLNLMYQPINKITNESGYYVNVGPRVFGFGFTNLDFSQQGYEGWSKFYSEFKKLYDELKKADLIAEVSRIGVKYVNLFDKGRLYPNVKYALNIDGPDVISAINIGFIAQKEKSNVRSMLSTEATVGLDNRSYSGEVFDLEAQSMENPVTEPLRTIKSLHNDVKVAFFSALRQDFIDSLEPSYEE